MTSPKKVTTQYSGTSVFAIIFDGSIFAFGFELNYNIGNSLFLSIDLTSNYINKAYTLIVCHTHNGKLILISEICISGLFKSAYQPEIFLKKAFSFSMIPFFLAVLLPPDGKNPSAMT